MKKVLGLCLVVLLSSTSVFARDNKRQEKRVDPAQRVEQTITDLKMNDKQAAEFRKINEEFIQKANQERESIKANREEGRKKMLAMREEKNAEMKKILSEEQYKQYLDKQQRKHHSKHQKGKDCKGCSK